MNINFTSGMSKAEEIAAIKKIASALPADSYLASLFNPQLLAWVEKTINDDMPPDVYNQLNWGKDLTIQQLSENLKRAESELAEVKASLGFAQGQVEFARNELGYWQKKYSEMKNAFDSLLDDYSQVKEALNESQGMLTKIQEVFKFLGGAK